MKTEERSPIATGSLYDYFQQEVGRLLGALGRTVPPEVQIYLANLCARFSKSEQLFVERDGGRDIEPLALMLSRAVEAKDETARWQILRNLGDTALYTSGFLSERMERRGVELDYVIELGGMAYANVSTLAARSGARRSVKGLYEALAKHFRDLVHVLWEFVDRSPAASSRSLLDAYTGWQRTGSERLERRLVRSGFVLSGKPQTC